MKTDNARQSDPQRDLANTCWIIKPNINLTSKSSRLRLAIKLPISEYTVALVRAEGNVISSIIKLDQNHATSKGIELDIDPKEIKIPAQTDSGDGLFLVMSPNKLSDKDLESIISLRRIKRKLGAGKFPAGGHVRFLEGMNMRRPGDIGHWTLPLDVKMAETVIKDNNVAHLLVSRAALNVPTGGAVEVVRGNDSVTVAPVWAAREVGHPLGRLIVNDLADVTGDDVCTVNWYDDEEEDNLSMDSNCVSLPSSGSITVTFVRPNTSSLTASAEWAGGTIQVGNIT